MGKRKKKGGGGKSASNKKAQAITLLKQMETKGDVKATAIEATKDLVVGVVGGGLAGAGIGKPSLLVGIGTSLLGHYLNQPLIKSFALGMMASGGYQIAGLSGTEMQGLEGAKERVKSFGENLKTRLYLDKILKPKPKKSNPENDASTNGIGNVKYFRYPSNQQALDVGSLDSLEKSLIEMGKTYERQHASSQNNQIEGNQSTEDIGGLDDERIY